MLTSNYRDFLALVLTAQGPFSYCFERPDHRAVCHPIIYFAVHGRGAH